VGIVRPLLVALAIAVAALAVPSPASADTPDLKRDLRVATFNIHHGAGTDGVLDLRRVARVVESNGMEVVGLQEVDRHWSSRSDFVDQAAWLAERLDMHVVYGANLDLDPAEPDQPRRQYGTAILSRYPILEWRNTLLPRPEGGEQRGLLEAELMVRGVPMRFAVTHLQHNSQTERVAQATRINELLAESDLPTVLVGDLNATPDAPEIGVLTSRLTDTWPVAGTGPGFTYSAEDPHKRIDYVLVSDGFTPTSAKVLDTDASDHLPVLVDLTLTAPAGT